jgi:hypothetical protein
LCCPVRLPRLLQRQELQVSLSTARLGARRPHRGPPSRLGYSSPKDLGRLPTGGAHYPSLAKSSRCGPYCTSNSGLSSLARRGSETRVLDLGTAAQGLQVVCDQVSDKPKHTRALASVSYSAAERERQFQARRSQARMPAVDPERSSADRGERRLGSGAVSEVRTLNFRSQPHSGHARTSHASDRMAGLKVLPTFPVRQHGEATRTSACPWAPTGTLDPSAASSASNSSPRSGRSDPCLGPRRTPRSSGHIQAGGTKGH